MLNGKDIVRIIEASTVKAGYDYNGNPEMRFGPYHISIVSALDKDEPSGATITCNHQYIGQTEDKEEIAEITKLLISKATTLEDVLAEAGDETARQQKEVEEGIESIKTLVTVMKTPAFKDLIKEMCTAIEVGVKESAPILATIARLADKLG